MRVGWRPASYTLAPLLTFEYLVLGLVLFVLILFASPLLMFSGRLLAQRQGSAVEYGALANRVGREFERSWLDRSQPFAENPL